MTFLLGQWGGNHAQDEHPTTAATKPTTPAFTNLERQVTAVTLESFDSLLMSFDSRDSRGTPPNSTGVMAQDVRTSDAASTTSSTMTDADEEIQEIMARLNLKQCRKLTLVGADKETNVIMPPNSNNDEFQVLRNPLQVSALSEILRETQSLMCLELYHMELVGSHESFVDFANAIEYQGTLQALSLEHCRLGNSRSSKRRFAASKEQPLDCVVRALCRNLYIRHLTLVAEEPQSLGSLSATTLGLLGSSQSLHTLRLRNMGMSDDETSALAHALKENNALRNLQVSIRMGQVGSTAMISMLTHNVSVETLDIVLEQVEDEDAPLQLARAMQSSKSLVDFDLSFANDLPLTSAFHQVYDELKEWKEVATEMAWKSTSLSNCPFIRLLERTLEYCLTGCCTGSSSSYKTL